MMARLLAGYRPRHARPRGRYRASEPLSSAGLYAWCGVAALAAVVLPGVAS